MLLQEGEICNSEILVIKGTVSIILMLHGVLRSDSSFSIYENKPSCVLRKPEDCESRLLTQKPKKSYFAKPRFERAF
jgi:hypothetical protein